MSALHKALRQAPDVTFLGELRDLDTVAVALHAAETGHLVLSTLMPMPRSRQTLAAAFHVVARQGPAERLRDQVAPSPG